jgi:serine phosphatase RsbU (regulator of sigma subunit)
MPRAAKRDTPLRDFLNLLWRQPLIAVPFALFFGTIFGRGRNAYVGAYWVSLIFAYSEALCMWALTEFILPRLRGPKDGSGGSRWMTHTIWYAGAGLFGAFIAAVILHFTLIPGLLGDAHAVTVILMFTLLFMVLFSAVYFANHYYRKSLDRVRADEEMNLARRIQRSFLLSSFPERPRFDVHALNVSSKQVSGDFYDVVPAGDRAFLLAIADVAGKGMPAALLSSMLQASLRTQANGERSVATILRNINALVYRSTAVHQFATFFLARIDEDSLSFSFSNAGHNYPVVFREGGARELLVKGGVVVGILEDATFEEERMTLAAGDRLVFYTDGVTEAANAAGEMFGEERLYQLVDALPKTLPAREVTERILAGVRGFLDGVEAGDDITLMVMRVTPPAPARAPAGAPGASAPTA